MFSEAGDPKSSTSQKPRKIILKMMPMHLRDQKIKK